jgi:hypothetical protein
MRARSGLPAVIPDHLVVFDGQFSTAAEWERAFDRWSDQREDWEAQHPGVVLPLPRVLSDCPFDSELPHPGVWSRPAGGEGLRCAEHGLPQDEH